MEEPNALKIKFKLREYEDHHRLHLFLTVRMIVRFILVLSASMNSNFYIEQLTTCWLNLFLLGNLVGSISGDCAFTVFCIVLGACEKSEAGEFLGEKSGVWFLSSVMLGRRTFHCRGCSVVYDDHRGAELVIMMM